MQDKFQNISKKYEMQLVGLQKLSSNLGYAKIAIIIAIIVCVTFLATSRLELYFVLLTGIAIVAAVVLWVWHYRTDSKVRYALCMVELCSNNIARINGEWTKFPDIGAEYVSTQHAYATDLDIVGQGSVFQWLNTTRSWFGRQCFANDLLCSGYNADEIRLRQEAIAELSGDIDFANDLIFYLSVIGVNNTDSLMVRDLDDGQLFISSNVLRTAICVMPIVTVLLLAGGFIFNIQPVFVVGIAMLVLQPILCMISRRISPAHTNQLQKAHAGVDNYRPTARQYLSLMQQAPYKLSRFSKVVDILSGVSFKAQHLQHLQSRIIQAKEAFAELERIDNMMSMVGNPLVYFALNWLLLWDYYCAFMLERWKKKYAGEVAVWFETIGQFESLLAFSHMPNVCSGVTLPQFINDSSKVIYAKQLGHPLIQSSVRICNDLDFANNIFIISGSNMSGKTTFMRTVGVNIILANAGSYVCAQEIACSHFSVITSMRTADDLSQGVSTFYAELKRVKQVLDIVKSMRNGLDGVTPENAKRAFSGAFVTRGKTDFELFHYTVEENAQQPLAGAASICHATPRYSFFLIDEIFKGTNSVDRLAGADAVITKLCALGAAGMVSTHDLELCRLADNQPRIQNHSFREYFENGQIIFDYKMRPGQSTTTNGRFLMEMVGL